MRKPRTKACEPCRLAKTRCSLPAPCTRCGKRGLNCRYDTRRDDTGQQAKPRTLRPLKPAETLSSISEGASGFSQTSGTSTASSKLGPSNVDAMRQTCSDGSSSLDAAEKIFPDVEIPSDLVTNLFDWPDSFEISGFDFNFDFDMPFSVSETALQPAEAQLEQRSRSLHQGALTAKMLFGKLASYSRIMADAKRLPPFIYPPCWSSQCSRCVADSPHRCLPETLAICSNLTQMYSLRREGSESFVWQQICAHLKQLRDQVNFVLQTSS